jgi:DNA-binding transcriptional regulator GbsR (MarR family)
MGKKKYRITRRSKTATATAPVHQKHDKGYRDMFSVKHHFVHFLKKYIQADWVNAIDENDLE